jgi:hypothetical protein
VPLRVNNRAVTIASDVMQAQRYALRVASRAERSRPVLPPKFAETRVVVVSNQTGAVRTTRKRISLNACPYPKDRAEPADRAQARQAVPDQSAHPYRCQTCQ